MKFTPDIKFVNDETLNEFVVTMERRNVGETDAKNDRDKRDREEHGMVQRKLAAALDIDTPMYSKIERGERKAKNYIFYTDSDRTLRRFR